MKSLRVISPAKTIWVDFDNTPHIPFFEPIICELTARGYSVVSTARDAYQVVELAELFQLQYTPVGRHYGKYRALKVSGALIRVLQLLPFAWKAKPSLAIAHGSRVQVLVCALLGIPCLQIGDYEHAASWLLSKPSWVMIPDVIPASCSGVEKEKVLKYPGIKEDVYVPRFVPDPSIKATLRLSGKDLVVTVRPPATEAHYHNPRSDEMFRAVIHTLEQTSDAKIIVLPRNERQARAIRRDWSDLFSTGKMIIPARAVDGLNLIWHSDLVISGGGTMNREAAALGVPVYSIFRGKIGAVDRYLAEQGRLVLIENENDLRTKLRLTKRAHIALPDRRNTRAVATIVHHIVAIMEGAPNGDRSETAEACSNGML